MATSPNDLPSWTLWMPAASWITLIAGLMLPGHGWLTAISAITLVGAVLAAVHHAEVVAHKVGEPYGTLVLAIAVTVIEVALIVSVLVSAGPEKSALARDTVFAAVMLVCNGIVGICLLVGGLRHHEQDFRASGATAALAVLGALMVITLVLPNYTEAAPGPQFTPRQLAFSASASLVLYGCFVFAQTVRHRDYFLMEGSGEDVHAPPPSTKIALTSSGMLLVCLVAVVGLAKLLSPSVEAAVASMGAPDAAVGIVIAALVLLPECMAAVRAANANRLQTSLNLALGSALACIGLTIPAVAVVTTVIGQPLTLGLDPRDTVLLLLTLLTSTLTLSLGKATFLQGMVHLAILGAYLMLAFGP